MCLGRLSTAVAESGRMRVSFSRIDSRWLDQFCFEFGEKFVMMMMMMMMMEECVLVVGMYVCWKCLPVCTP